MEGAVERSFFMNSKGKMQLIAKGCNSEIYVVNTPFGGAALKVIKHLSN